MKDVIDVLQLQREKARRVPLINYQEKNDNYVGARFIFECGIKLDAQPLTIATAVILYHRFFKEADSEGYDRYLIGASALYLAGKIKDDKIKIRDVINVAHNTFHRGAPPLELGEEYWNMRDAVVQAELLIIRMLKFDVNVIHPHKYMCHYLKTLHGWFTVEEWKKLPLAKSSTAILQDFHHDPSILDYKPQHVAIAAINLALQVYGIQVPLTDESDNNLWYNVFVSDLSKDKLWEITEKMMDVYEKDEASQRISNAKIQKLTATKDVLQTVKLKWNWAGHTMRTRDNSRRSKGRQRTRWEDELIKSHQKFGQNWESHLPKILA